MIERHGEYDIALISGAQTIGSLSQAIKELVENAIDSTATRIEIKITDDGDTIQVVDNGTGIQEPNHASVCLRGYTEKIVEFDDIRRNDSFGFRGEALSSLCVISDLIITTCYKDERCGFRLRYDRMGCLVNTSRFARSRGTSVTITKLFSNLPVRLEEFKRNYKREFLRGCNLLHSFCLLYPNIRFKLCEISKSVSKVIFETTGDGIVPNVFGTLFGFGHVKSLIKFESTHATDSIDSPIARLCNDDLVVGDHEELILKTEPLKAVDIESLDLFSAASQFVPSQHIEEKSPNFKFSQSTVCNDQTSISQISFRGWVSNPILNCCKPDSDNQYIYINDRPVLFPKLTRAINQLYKDYVPTFFPILIIFINMPYDQLDRNVTPDKLTVIMDDDYFLISNITADLFELLERQRGSFQKAYAATSVIHKRNTLKKRDFGMKINGSARAMRQADRSPEERFKSILGSDTNNVLDVSIESIKNSIKKTRYTKTEYKYSSKVDLSTPLKLKKIEFKDMIVVGQFNLGFILLSHAGNLFIVDQHASHEKIMYEAFKASKVNQQSLIVPKKLGLSAQQANSILTYKEVLKMKGFDVRYTTGSWYLTSLPQIRNIFLTEIDFIETLNDLMDGKDIICSRLNKFFASKACRSAVMIGDPLGKVQMSEIVRGMGELDQPWNCPHGRPTMRLLTQIISETEH